MCYGLPDHAGARRTDCRYGAPPSTRSSFNSAVKRSRSTFMAHVESVHARLRSLSNRTLPSPWRRVSVAGWVACSLWVFGERSDPCAGLTK